MSDKNNNNFNSKPPEMVLVLNEDYYFNEQGLIVMTEKYHLKRGYCCNNKCLHCPYELKTE
jgi:hypothetical protein